MISDRGSHGLAFEHLWRGFSAGAWTHYAFRSAQSWFRREADRGVTFSMHLRGRNGSRTLPMLALSDQTLLGYEQTRWQLRSNAVMIVIVEGRIAFTGSGVGRDVAPVTCDS